MALNIHIWALYSLARELFSMRWFVVDIVSMVTHTRAGGGAQR